MNINPYESPASASEVDVPQKEHLPAAHRIRVPARLMIVLGLLGALGDVIFGLANSSRNYATMVAVLPLVALHLYDAYAGWQLLTLRSRPVVARGAMLMLLPFLSPLIIGGIPLGWWVLYLLGESDIEEAFRQNNL